MGACAGQALLQVRGVSGESGEGLASKVRSAGQSRSFWPVIVGEYEDRASLQKQGVSNKGFARKVISPKQSRSFWPVVVGAYIYQVSP